MSEEKSSKAQHGLTLYNSMSRSRQDFVPLDASRVRLYVCGPTVYDQPHIGNGRSVVAFDVLFRVLRHVYGPDHVVYVRNITDVDDKIIARAEQDFAGTPLNEAIGRLTRKTAEGFRRDVAALACLVPSFEPLATDHIDGMIAMVADLIESGHAYVSEGHVLFDVSSMPAYGELSGKKLEDLIAGARVAVEAYKRQPADFVLWKPSTDQQPGWVSPWGTGRPGWHLECSAMAKALLGETFDIHGGGLDLIFPHHENEIAQSRCANDTKTMANIWMHNGFLQLEGRKMSKSEGNFVTIDDLLRSDSFGGRPWPGAVLRLALLSTHYRQPFDFTLGKLQEAEQALRKFARLLGNGAGPREGEGDKTLSPVFRQAVLDDLNTPAAIAELHGLAALASQGEERARRELSAGLDLLGFADLDEALLNRAPEISQSDEARINEQIAVRQAHIKEKNWAEADAIRDRLLEEGIQLMDGKNPETGERTTRWEKVQ